MKRTFQEIKGLKLSVFNSCAIICACILIASLFFATVRASEKYEELLADVNHYIELADQALYQVKKNGRGACRFYQEL